MTTTISHPSATRSAPAHDEQDLACPMCGYNLRGLIEARCPECGRPFDWDELRDPDRRMHPYLYEHHPERGLRAFVDTLLGGVRPRKFWTMLRPAQPSRPKRLVKYWLIYSVPILATLGMAVVSDLLQYRALMLLQRQQSSRMFSGWGTLNWHFGEQPKSLGEMWERLRDRIVSGGAPQYFVDNEQYARNILRQYGSFQAYIDATFPLPPSAQFFWNFLNNGVRSAPFFGRRLVNPTLMLLITLQWPLATAMTFRVFHWTMRRAKVRFVHLLRVAVYSCDALLWFALLMLVPLALSAVEMYSARTSSWPAGGRGRWDGMLETACTWMPIIVLAVITYRLIIATRRYLQFRHAIATVVSVQLILLLAAWKLALVWNGY